VEIRQKYRLRVEICIGTLMDVHKSIQCPSENREILDQFEALRKAVMKMDMSQASERDIAMVEKATNALLCEYRPVFQKGASGPISPHIRH